MYKILIIVASLIFLGGLANGITDTLQFHYSSSFAAEWNQEYWNPAQSWKAKYKKIDGELVRPLEAKYFGSTTFLVFTTDAWHLAKFFYHAFIRAAVTLLVVLHVIGLFSLNIIGWKRWLFGVVIFIALAGIQAAGFHVFYTLF